MNHPTFMRHAPRAMPRPGAFATPVGAMRKWLALLAGALAVVAPMTGHAEDDVIKLGYGRCAQCVAFALAPDLAKNVKLEVIQFNTGNDEMTALASKNIDVAQVTYQHYVTALDKGFDVVAIAGHIGGGSQMLVANDLALNADDWAGLKKEIAAFKAAGKPFRVAASRGSAQDLHLRGAFAKQGIDVNKDVQFINIPVATDHVQALRRGEVELICTVEPFATQILQTKAAKFFTFPYDQASGKLTSLILTRSDVIKERPKGIEETVRVVTKINDMLAANKPLLISTIQKNTGLDQAIATGAVANLYPEYNMYRAPALAIGDMMRELKYINTDVTAKIEKTMDYRFLESVTGKSKTALGY